jgi:LmbE family N-acetylglucosaminyl deacetylase
MPSPTILATFAHPDDESFGSGGTFAHYAAEGSRVVLVCATRGEVGEISDPALATPETLGSVREGELRCAASALGLSDLIFLGYRDSGMDGTAENKDPRAFANAPAEEVVRLLTGIIRAEQPEIVVTFDPTGGYGHPDHIAIHRHTVAAIQAAANSEYAPELGQIWQIRRLCYVAIPRAGFRAMRDALEAIGEDVSMFERFEQSGAGTADEDIHIRIDVSDYVDAKWTAFKCHRTQFGDDSIFMRLPQDLARAINSQEHFTIGWPEQTSGSGTVLANLHSGL